MSPWQTIRRIGSKNLWRVTVLVIKNPLFVWPTISATRETIDLSYYHYQRKHHENGPANAFRHALWNYLIAKKCAKWSKNKGKVLRWTKNITDWHELAFPNRELAKKMDLHNNEVGRNLFLEYAESSIDHLVEKLQKMTEDSVYVEKAEELKSLKKQLVHIIR
ncbi:DUF6973 domain-containing protein [Allomuricauda sp. SCSIO 65647]|uniref:DUF6973 domain-containing protein n=1 Tax=Allomuricauda sp. SCSIO 65647 TaxID=2908843 RepID=UPI001F26DFF0|nr:hypothetical protein [Muricauda sp. SCSIO 65647]UJH68942.1 hypothetical protein L0P89_06930 [Muricauda sp. SCSIO 65647]